MSVKMSFCGALLAVASLFFTAVSQAQDNEVSVVGEKPANKPGPNNFKVFWKEGLRLESADENFKLQIGGRIMNDWDWMDEDSDIESSIGDLEDGTEFRRVRLYTAGTIYQNVDFKLQFDWAGGKTSLKDAYLGYKGLPLGHIKVGHFKEPFSLEELTSSKYVEFMERALPNAFAPSRNTGLGISSHALGERLTWAAGVFRDTDASGRRVSDGGYNATARVTGLPWYADEGKKLLHLGAAVSYRNPQDPVSFAERPEIHLAPKFVNTHELEVDNYLLAGGEAALVCGPFSLQGEFIAADADLSAGSDASFCGFYAQASYFLTGEHRNYKKTAGSFSRVKPKKNVGKGGWGAWEVAARYSSLDLNDNGVTGGKMDDWTVGLNWHLNPNTRIMWNYVRADLDGVGKADLLGMRLQIDW